MGLIVKKRGIIMYYELELIHQHDVYTEKVDQAERYMKQRDNQLQH